MPRRLEAAKSRRTSLARAALQAVVSEVLQHAIQVFLISRPIIIEVEHTRLAKVAVNFHEILLVHYLVEIDVAVTYRLRIEEVIQSTLQRR